MSVEELLRVNEGRLSGLSAAYNPVVGVGSVGRRFALRVRGFALEEQFLPETMRGIPLVDKLGACGSLDAFISSELCQEAHDGLRELVVDSFHRLRIQHDFEYWCSTQVYIKPKGGGCDILFRLNRPQRKLLRKLEEMRLANRPIRLILLKARQWGGSTLVQIYMSWLQLTQEVGLNSLIVGHVKSASTEVKSMFERLINSYPLELLYDAGASISGNEPKLVGVGSEQNIKRIPQRLCNIKVGTAESPDSARGGDYNLVHCTEVGLWKKTEGKTPEDIIRSACSGVLLKPMTMIVYESTANGTGNFFHLEYEASKAGESQFAHLFVAWYEIEQYSLSFASPEEKRLFAERLLSGRFNTQPSNNRSESGRYLWWLWERGATLENIHWYISERSKYNDHGDMASEYPSDDIEAFTHSGEKIFDRYQVESLRKSCKSPVLVGDVQGKHSRGAGQLDGVRFLPDAQGSLWIWSQPEVDTEERVTDRYLVVVDIGGRSAKSDYSVIVVFDRLGMIDGGRPVVVAQWYGHIDMDLLAWKSAQIARLYDDALLVIESNTLETRDRDRRVDGDQSSYILNELRDAYDNLYARRQSPEEIEAKAPKRYGFHTNVSTKPMVITSLQRVLREGLYVERDVRCLDEYLCYERKPNGSMGAISGKHDDLLMTRAIGLHICYNEMPLPRIVPLRKSSNSKGHRKYVGLAGV